MLAPVALLVFAIALATLGPRMLVRAAWVKRAPGWGVLAWQGLTASLVVAVLMLLLALTAPLSPLADAMAYMWATNNSEVVEHYLTPAGYGLAGAAAASLIALVLRLCWLTAATARNTVRARRAQGSVLDLLGEEHPSGFVLIDHATPLVYCLPGLRGRIVVTSAALEVLTTEELDLVLAHERSHLRARHDIALAMAQVLRHALGPIRVFRIAQEQITTLVEMQADDAARDPRRLAGALVTLGCGAPQPGLAAGDVAAVARVRRLLEHHGSWSRARGIAVLVGTFVLLAAPMVLAITPMIAMVVTGCEKMLG